MTDFAEEKARRGEVKLTSLERDLFRTIRPLLSASPSMIAGKIESEGKSKSETIKSILKEIILELCPTIKLGQVKPQNIDINQERRLALAEIRGYFYNMHPSSNLQNKQQVGKFS